MTASLTRPRAARSKAPAQLLSGQSCVFPGTAIVNVLPRAWTPLLTSATKELSAARSFGDTFSRSRLTPSYWYASSTRRIRVTACVRAAPLVGRPPTSMRRPPVKTTPTNEVSLPSGTLGAPPIPMRSIVSRGDGSVLQLAAGPTGLHKQRTSLGLSTGSMPACRILPAASPKPFHPRDGSGSAWWQGGYRRDGALNWKRWVGMPYYKIVLWIMAGGAISVILPLFRRGYPRGTAAASREFWRLLWGAAKPYLLLRIRSPLT